MRIAYGALPYEDEKVISMHAVGAMNDTGEPFVNACATNSIAIGGSVFQPRIMRILLSTSS